MVIIGVCSGAVEHIESLVNFNVYDLKIYESANVMVRLGLGYYGNAIDGLGLSVFFQCDREICAQLQWPWYYSEVLVTLDSVLMDSR